MLLVFTKYARLEVALLLLVGGGLTALATLYAGWWGLLPALLAASLLQFYRDPPRRIPPGDHLLLAPADGKVVAIESIPAGLAGDTPQLRIMIFLSVYNVHVNRAPCAGRVREIQYRPGKFLSALNPACVDCNEANTIVVDPDAAIPGPVTIRQIAGVLARRIVCAVRVGSVLAAGERFGMIKLGSRTELTVPDDGRWRLNVSVGQNVKGGATILAERMPAT